MYADGLFKFFIVFCLFGGGGGRNDRELDGRHVPGTVAAWCLFLGQNGARHFSG